MGRFDRDSDGAGRQEIGKIFVPAPLQDGVLSRRPAGRLIDSELEDLGQAAAFGDRRPGRV
jgi:hypothetical protein